MFGRYKCIKEDYIYIKSDMMGSGYLCNPSTSILKEFCKEIKGPGNYATLDECLNKCIVKKRNNEFEDVKILRELGRGLMGATFLVETSNGKKYAMKREKIESEHPKLLERELIFYEWIDTLNRSDVNFFMKLHYQTTYKCDYTFESANAKVNAKRQDYKYCSDLFLDLKSGDLNKLLLSNNFSPQTNISICIQTLYGLDLMHRAGYHHLDIKTDNIAYVKVPADTVLKIKGQNVKSHGFQISIIDYGSVLHKSFIGEQDNYEHQRLENAIKYGVDLGIVTGYLFLRENIIYKNLGKGNFKQQDMLNMFKFVHKHMFKQYVKITKEFESIYVDDPEIIKWKKYFDDGEECEIGRGLVFVMMRLYEVFFPRDYWKYHSMPYEEPILPLNLVLFAMKHYNDFNKIIVRFIDELNNITPLDKIQRIPGGKRSSIPYQELEKHVIDKSGVFFCDGAYPQNFPSTHDLIDKAGQHIHKIYSKGNVDHGVVINQDTITRKDFVKVVEDYDGVQWAVLDHVVEPELDQILLDSLK